MEEKTRVMKNIYRIWFVKRVLPWVLAEAAFVSIFTYQLLNHVSFYNVFNNISSWSPLYVSTYMLNAFLTTEIVVQIALISLFLLMPLMFYSFSRNVYFKGNLFTA